MVTVQTSNACNLTLQMRAQQAVKEIKEECAKQGVQPAPGKKWRYLWVNENGKRETAKAEEAIAKYAMEGTANIIVQPQDIGNKKLMPVKEEEPEEVPVKEEPPVEVKKEAPAIEEPLEVRLLKLKISAKQDAGRAKQDAAEEKRKQQELARLQKEFWDCKGNDGKKDAVTIQRKKQMLKQVRVSFGRPT